tara:strand:+ start:128 stop:415 length:288 start_codon:yes stop_codon:yes gene_type:complete
MNSNNPLISDLENLIAEKICLKIEKWNLYLGDAGLARRLALECLSNLSKGPAEAVEIAMRSISVSIGDGTESIILSKFVSGGQKKDLEDILKDFI